MDFYGPLIGSSGLQNTLSFVTGESATSVVTLAGAIGRRHRTYTSRVEFDDAPGKAEAMDSIKVENAQSRTRDGRLETVMLTM